MGRYFTWLAVALCALSLTESRLVRKSVDDLSPEDILNLQKSLRDVTNDDSEHGYAAIAGYHGYPAKCKHGDRDVACCIHGMATFPQWHRLYVVQFEQALKEKGLGIGIPYWDWTSPLTSLPELVTQQIFIDSDGGKARKNAWYAGEINIDGAIKQTARAVDDRLFQQVSPGEYTDLFEQVLSALEYDNYCQFEVQFEIAHNTIHYLVGGRNTYSMSHLEYTAYDPIFLLHHSNVDRLYAFYEKLQEKLFPATNELKNFACDLRPFQEPMEPFNRPSNPYPVTKAHNQAYEALQLAYYGYTYDNLTLNGLDVDDVIALIKERKSHDRAFAKFRLYGIGGSANVRVKVCVPSNDDVAGDYCEFAGDFFILGGPLEMPWAFTLPYFFEITKTVESLGIALDGNYKVEAEIFSVNGTQLPSDVIPSPSVEYRPAAGKADPALPDNSLGPRHETQESVAVRKSIDRLTREEIYELREALQRFQNDKSVDGYQATAEFHGDPGKCPYPSAKNRLACCIHGMPTFPHWHRLFVVQVEDALIRRGSSIGIPYWDWTKPGTVVPALAADETYVDSETGETVPNPFYKADIAFLNNGIQTSRDVQNGLTQTPEYGDHTELFDAYILALAQDNFCDFEVQFEVAHNLIHALVGGNAPYSLSTLSYSAFDPIFYLHHSNVDRIWAIWTALQQLRGKPYKAHCAQSYVYQPLKPFAFSSPLNNNEKTFSHATPTNIYNYEEELGYAYDSLEFGGMDINELEQYINDNVRNKPKTYVGILLHGIQKSALAQVYVTTMQGKRFDAGRIALLGGPSEMAWRFDRVYKHDITGAIEALGLFWAQPYEVTLEMTELNEEQTPVDISQFPRIQVIHEEPQDYGVVSDSEIKIRKNVEQLTAEEVVALRRALANLQEDKSQSGYQTLGQFHGEAIWCPSPEAENKVACCLHGMPVFPHWHRLLVVQAEDSLRRHGYTGALPYWDWTRPMTALPALVTSETYTDPTTKQSVKNPFFSAHIDSVHQDTVRDPRPELFQQPEFGDYTDIAKQVLLALEQDDFCTFEVQYEIAHNFIHVLVGGTQQYSMASLRYTAFDPIFYLHHSNTDRIWAIWQALQKYRGKAYNTANCAIAQMRKPLSPFGLTSDINPDPLTREHSSPFQVFDYRANFHYEYDNLEFNGLTIPQLARVLEEAKSQDRVFAGFMLSGIKKSALVKFWICKSATECREQADEFYVLGSDKEMPWFFDRLYKYEITDQLEAYGLRWDDRYIIKYQVLDMDGTDLGQPFPQPTVLHDIGTSQLYGQEYRETATTASHIRKDLNSLSAGEVESLRAAFLSIQKDQTYENIASFHGRPGLCEYQGRKVGCCVHGMATFLPWHRLYVEQVEEALLARGSSVSVPYWDWTQPITKLPDLINQATYFNSRQQTFDPNPFFSGQVMGENAVTTRDPLPELFNNDFLYEGALFALEQTNFCDFEIQLEVVHNAIHSWLGGKARYSMSSFDYSAFDPVFFLHHANVDRLWAIWQDLQKFRGLPYNEADCAINLMRKPLRPFDDDTANNEDLTHRYSRPADTFDYRNHFHYKYDTLEFNGMSIPQLENLLQQRQQYGRVFAGFLLHNIGMSADVDLFVCVPTGPRGKKNCESRAGSLSILGGDLEMPFTTDRLYKLDITNAVRDLGLKLDNAANFELKVEIHAVNGSYISSDALPAPTIFFVPGTNERVVQDSAAAQYLVRKNINSLSPQEELSLLRAMRSLQEDSSADGFQSIASFHALPPLCPSPGASKRYACCLHGMATFPQWHRLYTVQVEDALRRHGSLVGIPYWDWARQSNELPSLLSKSTYKDPYTDQEIENPWYKARIEFADADTEREIMVDYLFKDGPNGWDTWLFNQALYALEQEDYCDFEIQLEITHNAVHSWVGGSKERSLGHLHYASYDPMFYIHHSNTDRLWAVWQALQQYRGKNPNEANCALEQMREPLKPFSFGAPYNLNPMTKEYSKPEDTFNYEDHFNYRYDDLDFVGMNIPRLDAFIKERQERDRVFAGFLLSGFGSSALVDFSICTSGDNCFEAGYFTVLGGAAEMPWQFDRLFKYEITDQLADNGLRPDDDYYFQVQVKYIDGSELDSSVIPTPSVIIVPAKRDYDLERVAPNSVRKNINDLTERDIQSLKAALRDLQLDDSSDGWASLASFHGAPARCVSDEGTPEACCIHGMPVFPHWHRLYTLQVEQALQRHGSAVAIPYWDWTLPITKLPEIFTSEEYYDAWRDEVVQNPFARGYIPAEDTYTVRDVRSEIFLTDETDTHSQIFELVLSALEQTDYCDFEVQFEVMHNAIHFLVGGLQTYSLSSLEYSAYDPMFLIHHSFTDKIWAVWQELQARRRLPANSAACALNLMSSPMRPFNDESLNINQFTRDHAVPNTVFNYETLGYAYDDLSIGGHDLDDLERVISERKNSPRVFAGFLLKGVKTSGSVVLNICRGNRECAYAGRFNLLGGPTEMPWAFDRLFKLDITAALKQAGFNPEDVFDAEALFKLEVKVYDVEGRALPLKDVMPEPTIIFVPAEGAAEDVASTNIAGVGVRKDVSTLTASEIDNIRQALGRLQADQGPNGFQAIAAFHGAPAGCELNGKPVACCQHGMANFPQWHRLFVKQFEDALTAQGAKIGIPYWDWTTAFTALPTLVTEEENNPFLYGTTFDGHQTTRSPRPQLFNDPEFGSESFFYRQALLAFEQTDYCDFEVQFEITHNAIHSWTGGLSPYGMSTLEYTAYDPLFLLHHSNVDRQFAIWQALQQYRGLPYNSANCAVHKLREPMRPFADSSNVNPITRANARAIDAFDYDRFNYQYDNLNFHGLTIAELNDILEKRKEEDRVFAEFLLSGIQTGADVNFELCDEKNRCTFAGTFAVLGGPLEMPWALDRLFKYDVTNVFKKLNLRYDGNYHFNVEIVAVNGTKLDSNLIRSPSVEFVPGVKGYYDRVAAKTVQRSNKLLRKDINQLTLDEVTNLRNALYKLQQDQGPNGFEAIAGFHGAPFKCPANGEDKFACCAHGMAIFPHWHRLHTVQFEQALSDQGASIGVPYWDWTEDVQTLPTLFGDSSNFNPFYKYHIGFANQDTTRDVQNGLFQRRQINGYNYLYYLALTTLEEDNYCDFEIQYEMIHNEVHALIGGSATYGMSTLDYSAFDPFFMIHHSSIDRLWTIWQQLQRLRRKPFNSASCASGSLMSEPLHPFNYPEVNTNEFTRLNSAPNNVFDIDRLGYEFDSLKLHGNSVAELNNIIASLRDQTRIYLGIVLFGRQGSFKFNGSIVNDAGVVFPAAQFYTLGGVKEMPWAYERLYKYDVTEVIKQANIDISKPVEIKGVATYYDGKPMKKQSNYAIIVERPAHVSYDIVNIPVTSSNIIPPKIVLKKGTRIRFVTDGKVDSMENLGSYTNMVRCNIPPFSYNSFEFGTVYALKPGNYFFVSKDPQQCAQNKRVQITIGEE